MTSSTTFEMTTTNLTSGTEETTKSPEHLGTTNRKKAHPGTKDKKRKRRVKLVLVGDSQCGKTCLLNEAFKLKSTFNHSAPTLVESRVVNLPFPDGSSMELAVWDTSGQDKYDVIRPVTYPSTAVSILCFSVDSRASMRNVCEKWLPELRQYLPHTPLILVAAKIDLRSDESTQRQQPNRRVISTVEGAALATAVGALEYVECSSVTGEGTTDVFTRAVTAALIHCSVKRKDCTIL